jgi:dihydrofolate reductase
MIMGRNLFELSVDVWPSRRDHPWAERLNGMRKYVFSSTLQDVSGWENSVVVAGDPSKQMARIKNESGGDLVMWSHTRLAETLMRAGLIDVLDVTNHHLLCGAGGLLLREGLRQALRLVATTCFTNIAKITYEPQYG